MAQPGRKSKRTAENAKRILDVLRGGGTRKMAYLGANMGHDAFAEWIKADKAFLQQVEEAEQAGNLRLVLRVNHAAEPRKVIKTVTRIDKDGSTTITTEEHTEAGDWRAAMRLLECRDPENFGKRLDVTSNGETIKGYGASVEFDDVL